MKISIRAVLFFLCLTTADPAVAQGNWIVGVEDLPLMPGLIERTEKNLVFDKPGGRIVEAEAIGRIDMAAARRFYADTLAALGWTPAGPDAYRREDEVLRIVFLRESGSLVLRFSINPEPVR